MFKGSMPALVTPFQNGQPDLDTLKKLVEWHIAEGSHGLVPVGTTGESPTVDYEEHIRIIALSVKFAARKVILRLADTAQRQDHPGDEGNAQGMGTDQD